MEMDKKADDRMNNMLKFMQDSMKQNLSSSQQRTQNRNAMNSPPQKWTRNLNGNAPNRKRERGNLTHKVNAWRSSSSSSCQRSSSLNKLMVYESYSENEDVDDIPDKGDDDNISERDDTEEYYGSQNYYPTL